MRQGHGRRALAHSRTAEHKRVFTAIFAIIVAFVVLLSQLTLKCCLKSICFTFNHLRDAVWRARGLVICCVNAFCMWAHQRERTAGGYQAIGESQRDAALLSSILERK